MGQRKAAFKAKMKKILSFRIGRFELLFTLIFLFGIALRVFYMVAPLTKISADEAVYGAEALNILKLGERPVFFYNQPYTGTFSAYVSAIFFGIFEPNAFWLKFPPLVFSIIFLYLNYKLALVIFNNRMIALLTLLFTSFTSPFWANWTTRAGTVYQEMMVFGNLIFILILKIIFEEVSERRKTLYFFLIGLFAGLGFWFQPAVIYYLIPTAIFLFFWKPLIFFSRYFYLGIAGFIVGDLPVIWWNLAHQNITTVSLINKPFGVFHSLNEFFTLGLPVIFGIRGPWSTSNFFATLAYLIIILYAFTFIYILVERFKNLWLTFSFGLLWWPPKFKIGTDKLQKIDLIFVFALLLPLLFSISAPFNQFVIEPRYISPIYTGLPILLAYFTYESKSFFRYLPHFLVALFLINSFVGYVKKPPDSFLSQYKLDNLISYLKEKDIRYLDAQADFSYRLILESKGEIITATIDNPPFAARYPSYEVMVKGAPKEQKGAIFGERKEIIPCQENIEKQETYCVEKLIDNRFWVYSYK